MHKSFPLLGLGSVQSKPILSDIDIRISIPGINLRNIVQQCVTPVLDNNIDNVEFRGKVVGCLFQSPTKDMAQKYGSTVKNLTLGFSPKLSGGVPIYVRKPEKNFGPKSQC